METYTLAPVVREELEEIAQTTRLSHSDIINIALINLFGNDNNFISCPTCGDHLAIKSTLNGEQSVEVFKCGCGTLVSYGIAREDSISS